MRSHHERGLGKEHPKSHQIQLLAAILFFFVWIIDSVIFKITTFFAQYIPFLLRLILFLTFLVVGCFFIFRGGHVLFHREAKLLKLITTGLFAHLRHPLYFGVLLIYMGFIVVSISLLSILGWMAVFLLYDRLATFEEAELEKLFEEEYREYRKKVSKWIPRF